MDWTGRTVLVTGAGGFIGSHLTEALVWRGARVRALVRYNGRGDCGALEWLPAEVRDALEIVPGDVRDPYMVDAAVAGVDTVFHLAALIAIPFSYIAPYSYVETNVTGTLNVLQAARRHGVRLTIQTSTSETYGTARVTPMDESHPLQAQSPYAASKIGADQLALSFFHAFDQPVTVIRPFNTYGPRQSSRAIVPAIIGQALTRDVIELGALTPIRDLTFVTDTVEGFLRVAETPGAIGETINVGTGKGIAIGDLAARILSRLSADTPIRIAQERVRPTRSEVMALICDNRKADNILNWRPQVTLDSGLDAVIEWMRTKRAASPPEIYQV